MTVTADFAGSSKPRQEVGLPGHCEECAAVGHVAAHPDLGCGDVGCTSAHSEEPVEGCPDCGKDAVTLDADGQPVCSFCGWRE